MERLARDPFTKTAELPRLIQLAPADVRHGMRCFEGGHIVFIAKSEMGSGTMRGRLVVSILRQSFVRHGANASFFASGGASDASALAQHLDVHGVDGSRRPAACIVVKYAAAWAADVCRRHGAITLLDGVDNYRVADPRLLHTREYGVWDVIAVQTRVHAEMLAGPEFNRTAVVLPHPHGNLGGWGVATGVHRHVHGIGFVYQDGVRQAALRSDTNRRAPCTPCSLNHLPLATGVTVRSARLVPHRLVALSPPCVRALAACVRRSRRRTYQTTTTSRSSRQPHAT